MINYDKIPSPCYIIEEDRLRHNLETIKRVKEEAGVNIIMAFKAFAMFPVFDIIKEYCQQTTASSLNEALLAYNEMGTLAHTYAPAYSDDEIDDILRLSSHITFNSISHYEHHKSSVNRHRSHLSVGLRINPEFSVVETDIYNPCAPGARLGVTADKLAKGLPEGIEGIHFHNLCESTSFDLAKTLEAIEAKFDKVLKQAKWINMGGGHLMTNKNYDTAHLIQTLKTFKTKYPHLQVILEPGAAFVWQTGELVSSVLDIVENSGIQTAILNVSFACHMPDCLEMPYKPNIIGATDPIKDKPTYKLGGNSCLSGDFYGDWSFDKKLNIGDKIIFLDMIHYTMVKTTMFNGVTHPSYGIWTSKGEFKLLKKFGYEDYKNHMG